MNDAAEPSPRNVENTELVLCFFSFPIVWIRGGHFVPNGSEISALVLLLGSDVVCADWSLKLAGCAPCSHHLDRNKATCEEP